MHVKEQLTGMGLSETEINVYIFLLENGVSSAREISLGTKIERTNSYYVLKELKKHGLVEEREERGRKKYSAGNPIAIINTLDSKKKAMEELLPELVSMYTTQRNKPKVKFYNGWNEVKEIYIQSLETEELRGLGSLEHLDTTDETFFAWYRNKLRDKHIIFRDVVTLSSQKNALLVQKELGALYNARFFHNKDKNFPTDVLLWNDNVALISLEKPAFGTVLTSKPLSQTFRIIFEMTWQSAKTL